MKKTAEKNNAHFTKFAFFKKGGLFDQMPVPAGSGQVPVKKGRDVSKYGGYNKSAVMFFIPVRYSAGKKSEVIIMSVEMLVGEHFLNNKDFAKKYTFKRLKQILGKEVDKIEFPLGMRPWKINTVLSLDGFKVCIAGGAGQGKCLIAQPIIQFSSDKCWKFYIKKIERFIEKCKNNPNYMYDKEYDVVEVDKNIQLYDLYIYKLENTIYAKRINAPLDVLRNGREKFTELDIKNQAYALANIHQVFGRVSGGCDLSTIGGTKRTAATVNFSSTVSNWKKKYSDVRLVDCSTTCLWEKRSENLLEIL